MGSNYPKSYLGISNVPRGEDVPNDILTQTAFLLRSDCQIERKIRDEWKRKGWSDSVGLNWQSGKINRSQAKTFLRKPLSQFLDADNTVLKNWFTNVWSVNNAARILEIPGSPKPYTFKKRVVLKEGCLVAIGFLRQSCITQYYVPDECLNLVELI